MAKIKNTSKCVCDFRKKLNNIIFYYCHNVFTKRKKLEQICVKIFELLIMRTFNNIGYLSFQKTCICVVKVANKK